MSLKEPTKEIFDRYGLTEDEYTAYITFLGFPQSTVSEVAGMLEKEPEEIQPIAEKLESKGFIRKITGIVDRYIPLEPYLEIFNETSAKFRDDINEIKDTVLADQSSRFENLEKIQENALGEIENSKSTQVEDFQRQSDSHDVDKKSVIDNARERFTTTGKALEDKIQQTTFAARDRFTETSETLKGKLETDEKKLEADLHANIDARNEDHKKAVNDKDAETKALWDKHAAKFTEDNSNLNNELDQTTNAHKGKVTDFEQKTHSMIDALKNQLHQIAEGFKSKYDGGIQEQKSSLNKITDDLLSDFGTRVEKLEVELKKDLDAHHQFEVETTDSLRPNLDEILEKYMIRMKKVLDDLKNTFSGLLKDQTQSLTSTNDEMKNNINARIEERQGILVNQVDTFENKTTTLISDLEDISAKLTDLGEVLATRGSSFKALLLGKHKIWVGINEEIQNKITEIGGSLRDEFVQNTSGYKADTKSTKDQLISEVNEITSNKNTEVQNTNEGMDKKQKETINAELDTLATDLSQECYNKLDAYVKNNKEVITKLKDSAENSLRTHREDYEIAINKHRAIGLEHKDKCNGEIAEKVNEWYGQMEREHETTKRDISTESANQIRNVDDYLSKCKTSNDNHTRDFQRDVDSQKTEQRRIYDDLLRNVDDNFKNLKNMVSELISGEIKNSHDKINEQINLFKDEVAQLDKKQHEDIDGQIDFVAKETKEMEEKLHAMLESQKSAYNENAANLQERLNKTIQDNIQNVKDAIADFTLNFMNSIDECYELAEENEEKLGDIFDASKNVTPLGETSTWHVYGHSAIIEAMIDAMNRTKSTVTIVTPSVEPRILEALSKIAFSKKASRFLYTTNWDLATYGEILEKMKKLGNIQFRNLKKQNNFFACSRDSEEIVLCPDVKKKENEIALVSIELGYSELFQSFIYPMFQANSRPI